MRTSVVEANKSIALCYMAACAGQNRDDAENSDKNDFFSGFAVAVINREDSEGRSVAFVSSP